MSQTDHFGLIAMGANVTSQLGRPSDVLCSALVCLARRTEISIRAVSRYYRTPCFPPGAGPDFANAALCVKTQLPAQELLAVLHEIEAQHHRERVARWAARTLDLDLIAVGQEVAPDRVVFQSWLDLPVGAQMEQAPEQLILPHPRLHERAFVLVPLNDIAPDWTHPHMRRNVADLFAALPEKDRQAVVPLPVSPV